MNVRELEEERDELEETIARIKGQIDAATAHRIETGEYADAKWFASAKQALRMSGLRHQHVLRTLAKERKANAAEPVAQHFMNVAREELDPEDFHEMLAIAKARAEGAGEREASDDHREAS